MKNWQVTYKVRGKIVTKFYSNMNTATSAVQKLASQGIEASYCPIYQGGNTI